VVVVVLWMRSNSFHPYSKKWKKEEAGVDQGTHLHESMKRWTNFEGVLEVVVEVAGDLEPEH
jgi:hypothetical protein